MGFPKLVTASIPEILPFPLYHGTSTIWRESIERHGLGGKRIVEELNAIAFYQRAIGFLESLPADARPPLLWQMELLATQDLTSSGNFRHGDGVYLTPSRFTALSYARTNAFGSEIVSNCHATYQLILAQLERPGWLQEYPELLSVFRMPPGKPMVVAVSDARTCELLEENGTDSFNDLRSLLEQLASADEERSRIRTLRVRAKDGDLEALNELLVGSPPSVLTRDEIMNSYGQQINFKSKVTYPILSSDIQLYDK
jgi:hypothetical protein